MNETITFAIFQEDGFYVAQGLEYDICSSSRHFGNVIDRVLITTYLEWKETGEFYKIPRTPDHIRTETIKKAITTIVFDVNFIKTVYNE